MDKKVAIITGGSRGVGADLAKLCAEKGWNMTITCSNSIDDAKNVAKECEKLTVVAANYVAITEQKQKTQLSSNFQSCPLCTSEWS